MYLIQPWKHQLDIIERAMDLPEYAIFADMGTGKTATAINILRHKFIKHKRIMRTMIFCPPVVRRQWAGEFDAHSKVSDMVRVLEGAGKKRLKMFRQQAWESMEGPLYDMPKTGIFITNYESLLMKGLFSEFKRWKPEILIFDESHMVKNHKAKRTRLAIELADRAKYKYILTGTPILNSPADIWAQFRILDGGATFDKNFYAFRAKYFHDRNAGMPPQKYFPDWRPRPGIEDQFNHRIYAKASRVMKADCLDLPPYVRQVREVEMTPEQRRFYNEMKKHLVAYLNDKACVATIAVVKGLRLQQIVSGFFSDDEGEVERFEPNPRIKALQELVEEIAPTGAKIIVWACFKENYTAIAKALEGYKLGFIHGGMTDKERQEYIESFQNGDTQIMVANQQAGGVGVNLTSASYAIYYSRNFSLEADLQSEARNYRGGSDIHERVTRIDLVCPDTIDQVVLDALKNKENLANNILSIKDKL